MYLVNEIPHSSHNCIDSHDIFGRIRYRNGNNRVHHSAIRNYDRIWKEFFHRTKLSNLALVSPLLLVDGIFWYPFAFVVYCCRDQGLQIWSTFVILNSRFQIASVVNDKPIDYSPRKHRPLSTNKSISWIRYRQLYIWASNWFHFDRFPSDLSRSFAQRQLSRPPIWLADSLVAELQSKESIA